MCIKLLTMGLFDDDFSDPKRISIYQASSVLLDVGLCCYAALVEPDVSGSIYSVCALCLCPSILAMSYGVYMNWVMARHSYEPVAARSNGRRRTQTVSPDDEISGPLDNAYRLQQTRIRAARMSSRSTGDPTSHVDRQDYTASSDENDLLTAWSNENDLLTSRGTDEVVDWRSYGTMVDPSDELQFHPQQRWSNSTFVEYLWECLLLVLISSFSGLFGAARALLLNDDLNPKDRSQLRAWYTSDLRPENNKLQRS